MEFIREKTDRPLIKNGEYKELYRLYNPQIHNEVKEKLLEYPEVKQFADNNISKEDWERLQIGFWNHIPFYDETNQSIYFPEIYYHKIMKDQDADKLTKEYADEFEKYFKEEAEHWSTEGIDEYVSLMTDNELVEHDIRMILHELTHYADHIERGEQFTRETTEYFDDPEHTKINIDKYRLSPAEQKSFISEIQYLKNQGQDDVDIIFKMIMQYGGTEDFWIPLVKSSIKTAGENYTILIMREEVVDNNIIQLLKAILDDDNIVLYYYVVVRPMEERLEAIDPNDIHYISSKINEPFNSEKEIQAKETAYDMYDLTMNSIKRKKTDKIRKWEERWHKRSSLKKNSDFQYNSDEIRNERLKKPDKKSRSRILPKVNKLTEDNDFTYVVETPTEIIYTELWLDECFDALFEKREYKDLEKDDAITKFMNERFPNVVADIGTIKYWEFTGDDILYVIIEKSEMEKQADVDYGRIIKEWEDSPASYYELQYVEIGNATLYILGMDDKSGIDIRIDFNIDQKNVQVGELSLSETINSIDENTREQYIIKAIQITLEGQDRKYSGKFIEFNQSDIQVTFGDFVDMRGKTEEEIDNLVEEKSSQLISLVNDFSQDVKLELLNLITHTPEQLEFVEKEKKRIENERKEKIRKWEERWHRRGNLNKNSSMWEVKILVSGIYPVLELINRGRDWSITNRNESIKAGENGWAKGYLNDQIVVGILRDGVEAFTVLIPDDDLSGESEKCKEKIRKWEERWHKRSAFENQYWIDPSGKEYPLTPQQGHNGFILGNMDMLRDSYGIDIRKYVQEAPIEHDVNVGMASLLLQNGWIRVSGFGNIQVWDIKSYDTQNVLSDFIVKHPSNNYVVEFQKPKQSFIEFDSNDFKEHGLSDVVDKGMIHRPGFGKLKHLLLKL